MLKWVLYVVGGLVAVVLMLLVAARLYVGGVSFPSGDATLDLQLLEERIRLPPGFELEVYAEVANARVLRFSRSGRLLVANPNLGRIMQLADLNGDGLADRQDVLLEGLNAPNGIDFHAEYLYVAEQDAIGRQLYDHDTGRLTGTYEYIVTGLPGGGNHWKKTLRFGPDGMMYLTVGSSCNVCEEDDPRRAAMVRYTAAGEGEEIIARGLRNSAGFDWAPWSGELYATDNGRDMLGDDFPPCELNRVEVGGFYGWPYANGDNIPDPDFGDALPADLGPAIAPVHGFRAHNAPLGIAFLSSPDLPAAYRRAAVVALHGSWNRSEMDGYKVVSIHFEADGIVERDFVTGFLEDGDVIGRPAELVEGPDGAIYIADDYVGAVYRVSYSADR